MYYTYVLLSGKDNNLYTGSTKYRLPVELVYYEACLNDADCRKREKYLKSGAGKRYLKNRLKTYLSERAQAR